MYELSFNFKFKPSYLFSRLLSTFFFGTTLFPVLRYCDPVDIMQEEFDRFTGYWWSPNATGKTTRILHTQIDESHLRVYKIPEPGIEGNVDDFTYPMAGESNALIDVAVAEFDSSDLSKSSPVVKTLQPSLKERFPWCEYLARAGWTPSGDKFVFFSVAVSGSLSLTQFCFSKNLVAATG